MKKLLNKIWPIVERALRTTILIILVTLAIVAILLLCAVAIITTAAEKFFALITSMLSTLLAMLGNRLLGEKEIKEKQHE